jgi:hypothetical protein
VPPHPHTENDSPSRPFSTCPQKRDSTPSDTAKSFGVSLLSGRPQSFFARIDKGDTRVREVVRRPDGVADHLLISTDEASGDIISQAYPNANQGTVPGLQVVFRTDRYVLVQVRRPTP